MAPEISPRTGRVGKVPQDSESDAEATPQRLRAVAEQRDDRGDVAVDASRAGKVEDGGRTRQELARCRVEAGDHAPVADERHLDTASPEPLDHIAGVRDDELEHRPVRDATNVERPHPKRVSDPAGNMNEDGDADAHAMSPQRRSRRVLPGAATPDRPRPASRPWPSKTVTWFFRSR